MMLQASRQTTLRSSDCSLPLAVDHFDSDGGQHIDSYVVFKNVPPDTMRDFSNQRHLGRIKDQSLTHHLLIINMPSVEHESATREFESLLDDKLDEMRPRLSHEMRACGAADVPGITCCKAPDASCWPRSRPTGRSAKWPSLVLEVGHSEPASKLQNDASWWLRESEGDVRAAVTLNIFRNHQVHLEMWQFGDGAAHHRPLMTQEVTVTKSTSGYSASAPMVIRFEDLFLPPPAGNGERDIVLCREDLEKLVELALED
jgi:hypothetical protein